MRIFSLLIFIALSACATPSQRISTTLIAYGLDARHSQCIGDYLENHMSFGQLVELNRAVQRAHERDGGRSLRFDDLISAGASLDPAIQISLARSGIQCALTVTS
jgi:hypothetical protein